MGKIERQELGNNLKNELDGYVSHSAEMVTVERYGAHSTDEVGYEDFDSTEAINLAITAAGDNGVVHFINKHYKVTDEIKFWHGQTIFAPKDLVLNGTDFVGANGDSVLKVTNKGDAYTALPALAIDISLRDITLTFVSAHGLAIGDIICLYDNTPYSWSSARDMYKKSEFCKVSSIVSDTVVLLDNEVFDTYDATTNVNFGVYKMNMGTFNIIGSLKVIQGKQGAYYAMKFDRLKDFTRDNLVGEANNGSYTAISINQCFNTNIKATATQEKLSTLGGDYGLAISNCQHVIAEGYFSASRHGVTTGGYDGVGAIICRDIKVKGTMKSNGLGNVAGVGCHGNIEYATFEGEIFGGIGVAGKTIKTKGIIHASKSGTCVYMTEVRKFDFDFSGSKFISYGSPSIGVIDFGGAGTNEADNMLGGTLNLSNIDLYAPNALRGVNIRTRNTNVIADAQKSVNLSNSNIITSPAAGSNAYYIADTGVAKNFDVVNAEGTYYNSENRIVSNTNIKMLEKLKGSASILTSISSKFVDLAVVFSKPYPTGYVPVVTPSGSIGVIGATEILYKIVAVSATGFTIRLLTLDGTNFSSAVTATVNWSAQ